MNNLNDIRTAMAEIVDEFGPSVYRLALSRTGNPDLSADVYQQTFLLLLEKKPKFSHKIQLKVWLLRSARKLLTTELRKTDNNHIPLENAPEKTVQPSSEIEFLDLVSTLDEPYREVTVLFYIEDMQIKDIAKTLDISVSLVKTRLHRARAQLEKYYKEDLS